MYRAPNHRKARPASPRRRAEECRRSSALCVGYARKDQEPVDRFVAALVKAGSLSAIVLQEAFPESALAFWALRERSSSPSRYGDRTISAQAVAQRLDET